MLKLKNNDRLEGIVRIILPMLIMCLGAGVTLYYILGPAEGYMTSDCTDSLGAGDI